jgi:hypothetical protein
MDLLRARAIPALIAALGAAAAAADPGCAAIEGTYRYVGVTAGKGEPGTLGDFATRAVSAKLYAPSTAPAAASRAPSKLSGNGVIDIPMSMRKRKPLASRVTFAREAGSTRLTYLDEAGRTLVESRLEPSAEWRCDGTRLARTWERMSGLADDIRTERVEETLERDAAGRLVHRESVTVIEGKGRGRVEETRFEPAR